MNPPRKPNIILIVLDAMRLDRSALLKASLRDFVFYENVVSTAPWTLPSHVSMFTGLYPSQHGSHETETTKCTDIGKIKNTRTTLTDKLKGIGYTTYGFSGNVLVSPTYGFDFDFFNAPNFSFPWQLLLDCLPASHADSFRKYLETKDISEGLKFALHLLVEDPRIAIRAVGLVAHHFATKLSTRWPKEKGARVAVKFVRGTSLRQPFFLFMNLLETHEPYWRSDNLLNGLSPRPANTVERRVIEQWTTSYDSQVGLVRDRITDILNELTKRSLLENTVVIVTSDHGQLMGEHGWIGHGVFLVDELIRVPLMIRYPRGFDVVKSDRAGVISLANLFSFVLELARGKRTDDSLYTTEAFAESWGLYESVPTSKRRLFFENSKILQERRICIYMHQSKITYNVGSQSVEERFGVAEGSPIEEELVERCRRFLVSEPSRTETSDEIHEDETVLSRLRMLGYV